MTWFAVVLLFGQPQGAGASLSNVSYPTHAACMTDMAKRAAALAWGGLHGRYLCMRHGTTDRQLARMAKGSF